MSAADAITLAGGLALAVLCAVYVACTLLRSNGPDEADDDARIDSIRGELDLQEMRTKKVRAVQ